MLRLLVAALIVGNLLFFGWSRGWLDGLTGVPAQGEREPGRVALQVDPERITLLPQAGEGGAASDAAAASATALAASGATVAAAGRDAATHAVAGASAASGTPGAGTGTSATTGTTARSPTSATSATASAPSATGSSPATATTAAASPRGASAPPTAAAAAAASTALAGATPPASAAAPVCLEAGPFTDGEVAAASTALRARVPAGWIERKGDAGEWLIYMGPYPDADWMARKKAELGRIRGGVSFEEVQAPAELKNGLSLGRFPSQAAAAAMLAQYNLRGIRTAKVVRGGAGPVRTWLRAESADAATAATLSSLKLPPGNKTFSRCTG